MIDPETDEAIERALKDVVERYTSETGNVKVTEMTGGRSTTIIDTPPGTLYVLRLVKDTVAAIFVYERDSLWYGRICLFVAAGAPCLATDRVGPFTNETETAVDAAQHAALMAEKENPEAFANNSDE